jgi:hypothetical protein
VSHVHSGSANHTSVSTKQGSSAGNVVTTNTHGNTGNPTATLTHTVNEPNAGQGHDHAFSQPSDHGAWNHTVTEPNAGAGHDYGFTQPSDHASLTQTMTQADSHIEVKPPNFALAFIIRTS